MKLPPIMTTAFTPRTTSSMIAQKLLSDQTFFIEFQGYLSNHAKHAIVALDKLGASDARIQEYWDQYTTLTPYKIPLCPMERPWSEVGACTRGEFKDWRGQKIHWPEMVQLMEQERKENQANDKGGDPLSSSHKVVEEFAPDLLNGLAGALFHGIIHLGWAIDAQNPWMISEGLAYLNFCHVPAPDVDSEAILDDENAAASLLRIAREFYPSNGPSLKESWIEPTKAKYDETFHPELVAAGFQWHLAKVLKEAHPIATQLPSWLRQQPLEQVWKDLYYLVTLVYLATRDPQGNGKFVVLHLITSLWGLEQVCRVLDQEELARTALEQFWAVMVATLSASVAGFPTASVLQNALDAYPNTLLDEATLNWTKTVNRGCAEEEEHNIKLVYVSQELWNRYGYWKGFSDAASSFTLTPNIGPTTTKFE